MVMIGWSKKNFSCWWLCVPDISIMYRQLVFSTDWIASCLNSCVCSFE